MCLSCGKVTLVYLLSSSVRRLVFSQSLISLDLIEDFLELSCRAKDEDKISPYKGTFLQGVLFRKFSLLPVNVLTSLNDPTVKL